MAVFASTINASDSDVKSLDVAFEVAPWLRFAYKRDG